MLPEVHKSFYLPRSAYAFDAGAGIWIEKGTHALRLRVTRKEVDLLEPFLPFFPKPPKQNQKGDWFVDASSQGALTILEDFYSHLRLTQSLAKAGIEYQQWRNGHKKATPYSLDEQETYAVFLQRIQDLHNNMYGQNIGEKPLPYHYLAVWFDQGVGSIDTSGKIAVVQMQPNNRSFIAHLRNEFGGKAYPKDSPKPMIWRITGQDAEDFLGKINPLRRKPNLKS